MERVHAHEHALTAYAMERLTRDPRPDDLWATGGRDAAARSAFTLGEIHPHDLATLLDRDGIAVRAGHHCAQPLTERWG